MASVPGPIISFRIGGSELSGAVRPALDDIKRQAKVTSTQIADEWRQMAAKIRAETALGSGTEKEITASRRELVSILDREISGLRTRNDLTRQELSNLKAQTLERERQASFLKNGPGLTAGTQSVISSIGGLLSKQTAFLGANLFGIQGGSQLGAGISGALEGLAGGGVAVALGGLATAALAVSAAFHSMAVSGAATIRSLENVSEKTGISITQLQAFKVAGETVGVSLDDLVTGFRKFSQALTSEIAGGDDDSGAAGSAKKLSAVLKDLKVSAIDPKEALLQVSDAFAKLPDGAVKSATAVALFGRSGLQMIPFLDKGRSGLEQFTKFIEQYGKITPEAVKATHDYEVANAKLSASFDKLKTDMTSHLGFITKIKTFLAESLLPTLDKNPGIIFGGGLAANAIARDQAKEWTFSVGHMGNAAKASGIDVLKLAHDISETGKAAETAEEKIRRFFELYSPKEHFEPGRIGQTNQEKVDKILSGIISPTPPIVAPDIGGFPSLPPGGVLGGISGAGGGLPQDVLDKIKGVNDEWYNQTASAAQKIQDEYQKNFEYFKTIEDLYPQYASEINATLVKLEQDKNKELADLQVDANKKFEEEAGKLFDDILSGNRKKLGKAIEKDLLEAVSAPLKKVFEQYVGNVFATIANALKIPGAPGATGAPASSNNGGILGGIFGPLFGGLGGKIGPGGTAGWWPGAVGGSGSGVAVPAGQVGIATQTMNVNAGTVNVYGLLGLPGAGPLGSSTGNFFGNLNPFSNNAIAGGIGGYGIPSAGGATGASSGGNVMSSLGPYLGGAAMLGLGLGGRNTTAAIMGASMLAKSALTQLSTSGILSPGVSSALGTIAPALPGVGMFASGVIQGGVGGTLEATAGGAMAGMTLGGPIGAAIGAGVGLISGVVSSLIQGQSFENRVKNDMRNQEYTAPPSETFSFAMGNSIAQTLSTGFNQSGGTFGTYGLPSGTPFSATPITGRLTKQQQRQLMEQQMGLLSNQPFLGFPNEDPFTASGQNSQRVGPTGGQRDSGPTVVHIHAMDSQSFSDFAQRNASTFSKAIVGVASLSSSGFGATTRRAAFMP
jgi:hypothetical protein